MTREKALKTIAKSPYSTETMLKDKAYIAEKLGITNEEFDRIISGENKTFKDYKNSWWFIRLGTSILRATEVEKKKFR